MTATETYERIAWDDRFNEPTIDQLRAALGSEARPLFDLARDRLRKLPDATEQFGWHGDCWRWAVEYRVKTRDEPVALLIPSPLDLQLAVPLDRAFVASLSRRQLKRTIRDGIDLVCEPFNTRWGSWPLSAASMVDDLIGLIEQKLAHKPGKSR